MSCCRVEEGQLLVLFEFDAQGRPVFNRAVIDDLCIQIGSRKVAIISTAGKFRMGKTFWNNVILHVLRSGQTTFAGHETIGGEHGMQFKSGATRHTKGIMIWSRAFIRRTDSGEEIAVLLMDTQGTYDTETDIRVSAVVFGLSVLMSSTQVFNVMRQIDAQDLDGLNVFIEFCRREAEKIGQSLVFLVRDAPQGNGMRDGAAYFEQLRQRTMTQESLRTLFDGIANAFESVHCHLVPPPPMPVYKATGQIRAADCGASFLNSLTDAVSFLLQNLQPKNFRNVPLTGKTLGDFVSNLVEHIRTANNQAKEIGSAYEAMTNLYFERARTAGLDKFKKCCDDLFAENEFKPFLPADFATYMDDFKKDADDAYDSISTFGNAQLQCDRKASFQNTVDEKASELHAHNRQRHRDCTLASAVHDSYSAYEREMGPASLALEGGRAEQVRAAHADARRHAFELLEAATSAVDAAQALAEKRRTLDQMIETRYRDLLHDNAIHDVQTTAHALADKAADEMHRLLAAAVDKMHSSEAIDAAAQSCRQRALEYFDSLVEEFCSSELFAGLDRLSMTKFFATFKITRLESRFCREISTFSAQISSRLNLSALRAETNALQQQMSEETAQHQQALAESEERSKAKIEELLQNNAQAAIAAREEKKRQRREELAAELKKMERESAAATRAALEQQRVERERQTAVIGAELQRAAERERMAVANRQQQRMADECRARELANQQKSDAEEAVQRIIQQCEQQRQAAQQEDDRIRNFELAKAKINAERDIALSQSKAKIKKAEMENSFINVAIKAGVTAAVGYAAGGSAGIARLVPQHAMEFTRSNTQLQGQSFSFNNLNPPFSSSEPKEPRP